MKFEKSNVKVDKSDVNFEKSDVKLHLLEGVMWIEETTVPSPNACVSISKFINADVDVNDQAEPGDNHNNADINDFIDTSMIVPLCWYWWFYDDLLLKQQMINW